MKKNVVLILIVLVIVGSLLGSLVGCHIGETLDFRATVTAIEQIEGHHSYLLISFDDGRIFTIHSNELGKFQVGKEYDVECYYSDKTSGWGCWRFLKVSEVKE